MNYTLITGASSGIGATFAETLAGRGHSLILTARSGDVLEALRRRLARPGVDVHVVVADLTQPGGAARLWGEVQQRGWVVEWLINNAGFGSGGDFAELDRERELAMIDLNVRALTELTHAALLPMRARRHGVIVNVASVAGFQPIPYLATYAATKAFVLNFSLALWRENRAQGVLVTAVCPGTTDTAFFANAGLRGVQTGMQTPQAVVDEALHAIARRRPFVVTGWHNRLLVASERWLPRRALLAAAARLRRV